MGFIFHENYFHTHKIKIPFDSVRLYPLRLNFILSLNIIYWLN